MNTRACKTCGAEIAFVRTEEGRWTPQNLDGSPHWQNCNAPEQHRRRASTSSPASKVVILDLETIHDTSIGPWVPRREGDDFPPPAYHEIVVMGVLVWDRGPQQLEALGPERDALEWFAGELEQKPTIITWNGRHFDMPVIAHRALKHGLSLGPYYAVDDYRKRYTFGGHLDVKDQLADNGAAYGSGLDPVARLCGLPGKRDTDGTQVGKLWADGQHDRVRRYCLEDVLTTAFLWLRFSLLRGVLPRDRYQSAVRMLWTYARDRAPDFIAACDEQLVLLPSSPAAQPGLFDEASP